MTRFCAKCVSFLGTAIIDSQTTKATEETPNIGYDGKKQIKGAKRHIMVE